MLSARSISVVLVGFVVLVSLDVSSLEAQRRIADVWGIVLDRDREPIEGLEVYLVHPEVGRSRARVTDDDGGYRFLGIPIPSSGPFILEVYAGRRLMFRNTVQRLGEQRPIMLR